MRIFKILLFVFVFINCSISANAQSVDSSLLKALIGEAMENNPRIQAANNQWKAEGYKVRQSGSLPDPEAHYTYFGESVETRVGPQKNKYGGSQKIPFPGKLSLQAKSQKKQADIWEQQYEVTKQQVRKEVKCTYYDLFLVDKAISIIEGEKTILESLEKVAQRRYESGLTPQQDVIKAQVELTKLTDKMYLLKRNRNILAAKMNSLLDRPVTAEFEETDEVSPEKFEYSIDGLKNIAHDNRQELLAADLSTERAEYEKSLAKFDYLPDFTLGFDYIDVASGYTNMHNDGQDAWMGTVSVNLPIWLDKQNAQLEEKKASLEAETKNYKDMENNVYYEVEDLYFKITTYVDTISLYKNALLPQVEQSFEAARIGYETGKVDFLNWLDSERTLLQTRLAYYQAIADYKKSIAYMERVVGKNLEGAEDEI